MNKRLSAAAALIVTGSFLWLAVRNVNLSELAAVLSRSEWRWLPAMLVIGFFELFIRAARWRILLSGARQDISLWLLVRLEGIGLSVNNILFMRLGEVLRAGLAARELRLPLATTLASVAVERALDVASLLAFFCAAAVGAPDIVPDALRRAGFLAFGASCAAILLLIAAEGPLRPGGALERALKRWPKVHKLAEQLALGAAVLRKPGPALLTAALSLSLWGVDALVYWTAARALSLGRVIGYVRSVLTLSWAGAGAALPAAPGGFGAFETMVKSILVKFGVDPAQALAYAFLTHVVMYLFTTALGLVFLYRVGLSLGELGATVEGFDAPEGR